MDFSIREYNKAYYDIHESVKDNLITILYGGRNSSKSHSTIQWCVEKLWNENVDIVWYRRHSNALREKAYNPILKYLEKKGIIDQVKCSFHNYAREIVFPKGNRLLFEFLDEGDKSKGIANVTYIIVDEVDQIDMSDFMTMLTSFRSNDAIRFIIMFNPVSDKHWLKNMFFNETPTSFMGFSKSFHYTIEDNKYATQYDYMILDGLKDLDLNKWKVERMGMWGTVAVDDPFLRDFDFNTHVHDNVPFFADYPLVVSFDFGKIDSCIVGQHFHQYEIESDPILSEYFSDGSNAVTRLREYREGDVKLNVGLIVEYIVREFGIDTSYIVTGDTSGGSDAFSIFVDIKQSFENEGAYMTEFPPRNKPNHIASKTVSNWCFRKYATNYRIDSKCEILLSDLMSVRTDNWGKIDKLDCVKRNIGHILDAHRYADFLMELRNFFTANPYTAKELIQLSENVQNTL